RQQVERVGTSQRLNWAGICTHEQTLTFKATGHRWGLAHLAPSRKQAFRLRCDEGASDRAGALGAFHENACRLGGYWGAQIGGVGIFPSSDRQKLSTTLEKWHHLAQRFQRIFGTCTGSTGCSS